MQACWDIVKPPDDCSSSSGVRLSSAMNPTMRRTLLPPQHAHMCKVTSTVCKENCTVTQCLLQRPEDMCAGLANIQDADSSEDTRVQEKFTQWIRSLELAFRVNSGEITPSKAVSAAKRLGECCARTSGDKQNKIIHGLLGRVQKGLMKWRSAMKDNNDAHLGALF